MGLRLICVFAVALLLAACQTTPQETKSMTGKGGEATTTAPATTGPSTESAGVPGVTPGTQADLVATVGDRIFFDFDKSDIRPDQRARIDSWAAWLRASLGRIVPSVQISRISRS